MALSIIIAIIGFGVIIFVHELGHFFFARLFKVTVHEFSIGMGPKIISKKARSGIFYSLRLLPIGGYVSMAGEDEECDDPNSFSKKSKLKRVIILFAGAFMNLLLGALLMFFCVVSSDKLYTNKIDRFLVADEYGDPVTEYQGLLEGDVIYAINSDRVGIRYDYVFTAVRAGEKPCTLTVKRGNEKVVIENFVFPSLTENGKTTANPSFFLPVEKQKNFGTVITETLGQTITSVKMVVLSVYDLIGGKFSPDQVSGPVGIVGEIKESAKSGPDSVAFLISLIAINIGIFNLLPFPALDGGRIVFIAIEALIRRPINKKIENAVNLAGLAILFCIMILVTFKDIFSLF